MFKYFFSFNLDTRIHTSPKEDGHGSQALGPKGVVFKRKDSWEGPFSGYNY